MCVSSFAVLRVINLVKCVLVCKNDKSISCDLRWKCAENKVFRTNCEAITLIFTNSKVTFSVPQVCSRTM